MKIFLAIVGLAYLVLSIWCSVAPAQTSQAVGFNLTPGHGQSEFLTVYGGLELALALVFLWPLLNPAQAPTMLVFCLVLHGCLVLFRSAGFVLFDEVTTTTYSLAASEWVIFITSLIFTIINRAKVQEALLGPG